MDQQQDPVFNSVIIKQQLHENLLKFPPFYTIQEHQETRKKQLLYWSEITHKYFKENKIQQFSVSQLIDDSFPLFQDRSSGIIKKLSKDDIRLILDELEKVNSITWDNLQNKENFQVSFFSSFEIANCINDWAKRKHLSGTQSIETLQYIRNGAQTGQDEKFYNLPEKQIEAALNVLEQEDKGEVIVYDNTVSFKFV